MTEFKKVTTYSIYNHKWYIMYSKKGWEIGSLGTEHYCAFRSDWIDENGNLNRVVNGLDMHLARTPGDVITSIKFSEDLKNIIETTGCDALEACKILASREGVI